MGNLQKINNKAKMSKIKIIDIIGFVVDPPS